MTTTAFLQTRQSARIINGVHTEVLVTGFRDKILVLVTQYGKIGSLLHVTMQSQTMTTSDTLSSSSNNVNFLLGSHSPLYQLYATNFSTIISSENPNEGRSLLIGLALKVNKKNNNNNNDNIDDEFEFDKELFEQVELMVKECKVW
ncbi:hypothetical protein Glove_26g167 [Diversispora epigaea]|uniref:Uncharacterized protein n=1 Tax=Diversispora epigaea TaxID=1348612 RepID=A0A397JT46_9GLOM|nr:hypothetical protein Glove_26g167 [Diversispora epigaea]